MQRLPYNFRVTGTRLANTNSFAQCCVIQMKPECNRGVAVDGSSRSFIGARRSARQAHTDAGALELRFECARVRDAEVEDAGGEGGVGTAGTEDVCKVLRGAGAA